MKCPKCGYHSFDHMDSCKKCGKDLAEHKAKFNLRGFFSPGQAPVAEPEPVADEGYEEPEQPGDGSVDFGFDFLDEEDSIEKPESDITLGDDRQDVNIDQPFGADSETIPADTPASDSEDNSDDKPGKGPEFAF
ncbi:MAG: hypothetical protein DRH08_03475 [Deltaproteobacteria bacterium]|nr:MAG: hypothetical protein DRH08_03475 [Deltaproteobacteria bacterium]